MAKNFKNSDYAKNKNNKSIIYQSASGTYELSEEMFLASDPNLTHEDYLYWKNWSDENYHNADLKENREKRKVVSTQDFAEDSFPSMPSAEEIYISQTDDESEIKATMAKELWNCLTETQKKRFYMHEVEGKTIREIADLEGTHQRAIFDTLEGAKRKIEKNLKKILENTSSKP